MNANAAPSISKAFHGGNKVLEVCDVVPGPT